MHTPRYFLKDIATILDAGTSRPIPADASIDHLLLDSRRITFPGSSLFFAISGQRHDGHDFLADAYTAGVRYFVVSRPVPAAGFPEAIFLHVPDTLGALQQLAAYHRQRFELTVIGITGSNGKTITKEWLFQLLRSDRPLVRNPGSYNSQVGVPLSVWEIGPSHELGLFEAGISRPGEMEKLASIIRCQVGLFTNLGEAHSEGFSSRQQKLQEKLRLFDYAETIIYCRDDPQVDNAIRALGKPTFSWTSGDQDADLRILEVSSPGNDLTDIRGHYQGKEWTITIPFTDEASLENAIHCWATLLFLGLDPALLPARLRRLEPVAMRLELLEGAGHCTIINDSYNSDLNSLEIALHFLDQQRRGGRRTLILSDILESGQDLTVLYQRVAALIEAGRVERLFGIGREVVRLAPFLHPQIEAHFFADTSAFLAVLARFDFRNEVVLLKGARPFAFERIARRLALRTHRTALEINLDALVNNLNAYRRRLETGTRMMAMVKAAAYGSGSLEVARLLEFHRLAYLAVAYPDEGVELRQGGIQSPIMVLNPGSETFDKLARFRLEPEVFSLRQLQALAAFTRAAATTLPVHLKLDTGMHRLGFEAADLPAALDILITNPQLPVQTVFSHLAASDEPEHDAFTIEQLQRFQAFYRTVSQTLGYQPQRHILNSSGISRFPQYQMEIVRLGIGLYGFDPSVKMAAALAPVFRMAAHISQIKHLSPGETVGYGRRGLVSRPMRIATITAGYADGLPRAASNGRYAVHIRGQAAPTVGSVCMDMAMVDISTIPEAREGDEVTIFGNQSDVEKLAAAANTIPYEILTGIAPRVPRIYVQG